MRSVYGLNGQRAEDQVRAQSTFMKVAWVWYVFYALSIGSDILKFALEDPTRYSTLTLAVRTVWYLVLFLSEQASILRVFLVLGQLEMSALYLNNRLSTLSDRIERVSLPKLRRMKLNRFAEQIVVEYRAIICLQWQMNRHCERCFQMYFMYCVFMFVFPIVLLFEDHSEYFLIIFNLISYLCVVFGIIFPPILFNTYFTRAVSFSLSLWL